MKFVKQKKFNENEKKWKMSRCHLSAKRQSISIKRDSLPKQNNTFAKNDVSNPI